MRQSPWFWIPSLFGAEAVPAAIITYVSLLMFLQAQTPPAVATVYCGCLFVPWLLKSFLREQVRRLGLFRRQIQWLQLALTLSLMLVAFTFSRYTPIGIRLFLALFLLSFLTAWHELAARMYYERMLLPQEQQVWNRPKMFFSQAAVVFTYGLMLMMVGALQVMHRRILLAWNEACYLVSGVLLCLAVYHVWILRRPSLGDDQRPVTPLTAMKAELRVMERIRRRPYWGLSVGMLFLLLLPQSLLFYTRVLFLLAPVGEGGLGCTLQEVAFAQGTVGVLGFSVGLVLGRKLLRCVPHAYGAWLQVLALGFGPAVYWFMAIHPPTSLEPLCLATLVAQFFFGLGLPMCLRFVRYISGNRYRNTINFLYIPLLVSVMLLPIAASGWLVGMLGFRLFFLINTLTAPLAWLALRQSRAWVRLNLRTA